MLTEDGQSNDSHASLWLYTTLIGQSPSDVTITKIKVGKDSYFNTTVSCHLEQTCEAYFTVCTHYQRNNQRPQKYKSQIHTISEYMDEDETKRQPSITDQVTKVENTVI